MTERLDSERQTRAVRLMLAIVGAFVLVFGWFQWSRLVELFR